MYQYFVVFIGHKGNSIWTNYVTAHSMANALSNAESLAIDEGISLKSIRKVEITKE